MRDMYVFLSFVWNERPGKSIRTCPVRRAGLRFVAYLWYCNRVELFYP